MKEWQTPCICLVTVILCPVGHTTGVSCTGIMLRGLITRASCGRPESKNVVRSSSSSLFTTKLTSGVFAQARKIIITTFSSPLSFSLLLASGALARETKGSGDKGFPVLESGISGLHVCSRDVSILCLASFRNTGVHSGAPAARRAAKRSPIPIEARQLLFSW